MRAIVMADLHVGFRAFSATIEGRNAREVDVERALGAAINNVVDRQPDLLALAGDCFHHARVGMHAVLAFRDGIRRVLDETDAHIAIIPGNHDLGRTAEVLTPVAIARGYERVHVALTPQRIRIRLASGEVCAIAAFPPVARATGDQVYELEPDPDSRYNVALIHAAVRSSVDGADRLPSFYIGEHALDVGREAERWDLIACGDYHTFTRLHPTALALYPGSIERTSSNIWDEAHDEKGIVLCDLDERELEFLEVPTRPVHDYGLGDAMLDFDGPAVQNVNAALRSLLEAVSDRPGEIIRLRVDDFRREDRDAIDWATVRQIKNTCLAFQLDLRFSKRESITIDRRERPTRTLADEAHEFFADDPGDVRALAITYLAVGTLDHLQGLEVAA